MIFFCRFQYCLYDRHLSASSLVSSPLLKSCSKFIVTVASWPTRLHKMWIHCMTTNSGLGFKVDHCSGLCFKITNWFIKLPFSFIWPFMPLAFLLLHIKFLSAYWLFLKHLDWKYVYKFAKYLKNMNKQLPVNIIKIEMQIFSWTLRNYLGFYNILSLHSSV